MRGDSQPLTQSNDKRPRQRRPGPRKGRRGFGRSRRIGALCLALGCSGLSGARGEAMLELFSVSWSQLLQKMPEIAEAGYTSLWLPPPVKAGSVYSVGYDVFDPFDLGDKNQQGTVATRYGTKAQLLAVVEMAHRFGLRVYFDNITNHRGFAVPGYDASTPANLYPGMAPGDFHLQTVAGGYFVNWPNISNWGNVWEVQNQPLSGLLDIANEPGAFNVNFGPALGTTNAKPVFIRQPGSNSYYMDPSLPSLGGPWRPFNGNQGAPVAEDVNAYLIRAVLYLLNETKCDGFRLDAVKHVPSGFFGDTTDSPNGYCGAIQVMFDYVHGYGNNLTGNGYVESDDNRNSVFDTECPRNDAMLFGEHLGEPPTYAEYLERGMRLLNAPLQNYLNNTLGNASASLAGLEQRDFVPAGSDAFSPAQGVQFVQSQDNGYANHRELQVAYIFMREGLPELYSDGYNEASGPNPFPAVASAPFLGQFGDNKMPEAAYLHHQLARGGTRPRWSDSNLAAFERYDYRDVSGDAYSNPDATVVLFAMNDNLGYPGDVLFDDGLSRPSDGYYSCANGSPSRGVGLVVGFPPGSVLAQLAGSAPGTSRACPQLLVHYATNDRGQAAASANDAVAINRLIYVGSQALAPGGGAIELLVPSGGWVAYGYQWPEASRAAGSDAITFRQGGADAPRVTMTRSDGVNGDPNFNPLYPFKMRGRVDASGNVVGGVNVSNLTYAIDIPVLTNAPFDLVLRCDASAVNVLAKLDGGLDLNRQMGLGSTNLLDARDNRPGYATDVFLGYEQAQEQFRYGPEKFAARLVSRNNVTSAGAETYAYTVGGATTVVNGNANGNGINTFTAAWVYHDPAAPVTVLTNPAVPVAPATQLAPYNPGPNQAVAVWVKAGCQFRTNHCSIYYTTDGSEPAGAFGVGQGTTKVVAAAWMNADAADGTSDWWKGTIPASVQAAGAQVRYQAALFQDNIPAISDAGPAKVYGLTQFGLTNFNPVTATVWLHNDLNTNNTATGLSSGFHIVRARCFLPRDGKSGVYNTFLQTFYYDGQLPAGAIAYPPGGGTISSASYQVVVRTDSTVTAVDFNIRDSDPNNDDAATGQNNGNGLNAAGQASFAAATPVTPDATIGEQYPNYPQEFRFSYGAVPGSGPVAITVRLKGLAASVLTNRLTTLTVNATAQAPASVLRIASPAPEGALLPLGANEVCPIQVCFSSSLTASDTGPFSLYVNGVLAPRSQYSLESSGSVAACPGMRALVYNWTNALPGTNVIEAVFNNLVRLTDTRVVRVAPPFRISSVAYTNGGPWLAWESVPGLAYRVWATTNLGFPMAPVSPVIPALGQSTNFLDWTPGAAGKFYRIQVVP